MKQKFLSVGTILSGVVFLLSLFCLVVYEVNIHTNGYFQGVTAKYLVGMLILAMVLALLVFVRPFLPFKGGAEKFNDILTVILKIAIPVVLAVGLMGLVQSRIEGLGYIYFSNVDVAKEVATPANLASASVTITAISFAALAMVVGVVAAFFQPKNPEAE